MSTARTTLKVTSAAVDTVRRPRTGSGGADLPPGRAADVGGGRPPAGAVRRADGVPRHRDDGGDADRRAGPPRRPGRAAGADGGGDLRRRHRRLRRGGAAGAGRAPGAGRRSTSPPTSSTAGIAFPDDGVPLSWSALRDAVSTGLVEVGSHTHGHALLDRLARRRDRRRARPVDRADRRAVGVPPAHFAYPKAVMGSPAADAAVRARFDVGRGRGHAGSTGTARPTRTGWRARPIQVSDGMRWFRRKVAGGMRLRGHRAPRRQPSPLRRRHHLNGTTPSHDCGRGRRRRRSWPIRSGGRARVRKISSATAPPRISQSANTGCRCMGFHAGPGLDVERLEVLADRRSGSSTRDRR